MSTLRITPVPPTDAVHDGALAQEWTDLARPSDRAARVAVLHYDQRASREDVEAALDAAQVLRDRAEGAFDVVLVLPQGWSFSVAEVTNV